MSSTVFYYAMRITPNSSTMMPLISIVDKRIFASVIGMSRSANTSSRERGVAIASTTFISSVDKSLRSAASDCGPFGFSIPSACKMSSLLVTAVAPRRKKLMRSLTFQTKNRSRYHQQFAIVFSRQARSDKRARAFFCFNDHNGM